MKKHTLAYIKTVHNEDGSLATRSHILTVNQVRFLLGRVSAYYNSDKVVPLITEELQVKEMLEAISDEAD